MGDGRSIWPTPHAARSWSLCTSKNFADQTQKRSFSTWRNQDQRATSPVILDAHVIKKETDEWSILLV